MQKRLGLGLWLRLRSRRSASPFVLRRTILRAITTCTPHGFSNAMFITEVMESASQAPDGTPCEASRFYVDCNIDSLGVEQGTGIAMGIRTSSPGMSRCNSTW